MRRAAAGLVALLVGACGAPELAPTVDARPQGPPGSDDLREPPLASPCPGSDEAFVFRALRLIEGRRPRGVAELRVLADLVADLDAAGLPGRELVARGLTRGDRYREAWTGGLLDLLRVPRLGATADRGCYARPGPLADTATLAGWIRVHDPADAPPAQLSGWTMADLLGSALALDDLSPLLRAHLLVRGARPVGGNNVAPADLERARRVFVGRGFEAAFLGRRLECVACHDGGGATVLDSPDPALDRTWPIVQDHERKVYGPPARADEGSAYGAFRFAGIYDRGARPWGSSSECPRVALDPAARGDDPLAEGDAYLGGPRPEGASAVELERSLARGFDRLRAGGLAAADGDDPEVALAAMIAVHLADAAWREASGRPLTMAHGQPRNPVQRAALRELSERLVASGFSLRELLVAVATHPLLDLAEPTSCAAPLPALLDPFAATNDHGDAIRREDPWRLIDAAALAMQWPALPRWPLPYGWVDAPLVRSLGAFIDESEPGHRSLDVVALLAWEAAVGAGVDPRWLAGVEPRPDLVDRLLARAADDPAATVLDLAIAVEDQLLQERSLLDPDPAARAAQRAAVAALLDAPLDAPVAAALEADADALEAGLRRFAGALLQTPQFVLAGLPPADADGPLPRLLLAEATPAALCEAHAPAILQPLGLAWRCDSDGVSLAE
ncbi:MAG: hypothetical protein R3A79_30100 [Nannocystaceae bacterium]